MVDYVSRAEWGARRATGSRSLVASRVENVAVHWPGSAKAINAIGDAGFRRVCSALRGWQAYHMDGRGWSDIAYQVAVDQAGRAYTLRGINIQSGANGNQDVNQRFGAILVILGPGEEPSAAMKATVKAVMADYRKRFYRVPKRPTKHRSVRPAGTDCPGNNASRAIDRGDFDAGVVVIPPTPPTPPALDDWEEIMALFNSKEEFEASVAKGVYDGNYRYWRDFFKDGAGTGDMISDTIRGIKADTAVISANTKPDASS